MIYVCVYVCMLQNTVDNMILSSRSWMNAHTSKYKCLKGECRISDKGQLNFLLCVFNFIQILYLISIF